MLALGVYRRHYASVRSSLNDGISITVLPFPRCRTPFFQRRPDRSELALAVIRILLVLFTHKQFVQPWDSFAGRQRSPSFLVRHSYYLLAAPHPCEPGPHGFDRHDLPEQGDPHESMKARRTFTEVPTVHIQTKGSRNE